MKEDLITIAIPVYNREKIVGKTLESIVQQTYRPLNVVLVDNNSSDATLQVLQEWKWSHEADDFKIKVLVETEPGGSAARNKALSAVETEWTLFFDSDDIMLPHHIEYAAKAVAENPDADLIGWDQLFVYPGKTVCSEFHVDNIWFYTLCNCNLQTQRYMAKTELFRAVGGWNTALSNADDLELGIRLLKRGVVVAKYNEPSQVQTILSADSITRGDKPRILRESVRSWRIVTPIIPDKMMWWADFGKVYQWAAIGKVNAKDMEIESSDWTTGRKFRRMLLKSMYRYTVNGGRGALRLFLLMAPKSV